MSVNKYKYRRSHIVYATHAACYMCCMRSKPRQRATRRVANAACYMRCCLLYSVVPRSYDYSSIYCYTSRKMRRRKQPVFKSHISIYCYILLCLEVLRSRTYSPISVIETRTLMSTQPGMIIIHHWSDRSAS